MAEEDDIRLERDLLEISRERAEALLQEKKLLEANNQLNARGKEILQANLDLTSQELEVARQKFGALKEAQKKVKEGLFDAQAEAELKRKGLKYSEEALEKAAAELATKKVSLRTQREANTAAATLLKRTIGVSDAWKGTLSGALLTGAATKKLHLSLKGLADPLDLVMSGFQKIVEMSILAAQQYDSMAASIRKIAGADSDLAARAYESHRAMLEYGVSIDETGQATQALYRDMAIFSHSIDTNQDLLRDQVALLNEVGVAFDVSAKMMNTLDKGLGMSAPEIKRYTARLHDMAEQLQVPPQVIFNDWQASAKELMKYGDQMDEVLYGLEKQSKNTGLAVSELIGIAKQFDQFDSAGESVGRLNAILGGPYLNAIDMVYMKEDERVQALRDTIQLSGQVWKDLNRHEQQAIATAAGISDMSVAAQLFGGTHREFANAAENQAKLEERAIAAQSAMDQMKNAFMGFAVAIAPFVETLTGIATGFAHLMSAGKGAGGVIMGVLALVAAGISTYLAFAKAKAAATMATRIATLVTVAETMVDGTNTAGKVANAGATEAQTKQELFLRLNKELGIATQTKETSGTWLSTAAKWAGVPATKALSLATGVLATSLGMVAATLGVMLVGAGLGAWIASFGTKGYWTAIAVGLIAVGVAIAMVPSALTAGAASATTLKSWALLGAGGAAMVTGALAYHEGGVVAGTEGEEVTAKLMPGETVLATHKKSGPEAAADAGIVAPAPDMSQVTNAINNLVAKLDTIIKDRKTGQQKAVDVTMSLDQETIGMATATWIDDNYGL